MEKEGFKWIPGFKGYYKINKSGVILSFKKKGETPRKLKQSTNDGYYTVSLNKNGGFYTSPVGVHRLVLLTFIGKPKRGYVCRHINGVKKDNRLENLAWGTRHQNWMDALNHGVLKYKIDQTKADLIRDIHKTFRFSVKKISHFFSVKDELVRLVIRGKTWTR